MNNLIQKLTFARSYLSSRMKKFIFTAFDNNIEEALSVLQHKVELPNNKDIQNEINNSLKNGCKFISLNDNDYPIFLKFIDDAPILLSIKGNNDILKRYNIITISGTRNIEPNDVKVIENIISELCNEFIISSGLAVGCDTTTHLQSYKSGSIVVLANGLKHCYPKENKYLLDKIIDNNGCAISEYRYNQSPKQVFFLQRDRILAGISASTLIMRARNIKSGTIATANFVRNINRKLYTILPNNGECYGNKWLLEHKYANIIDDSKKLKFNIIKDIEELKSKIEFHNSKTAKDTNALFKQTISYNDKNSIKNEILSVIKLKKYHNITFSNLLKVYHDICVIHPEFEDNNIVKQVLIELIQPIIT